MDESAHGFDATDAAMSPVGAALLNELRRGLSTIGFEVIAEDSFGLLAVRVADRDHVGTAYVEFKDGEIRTQIVLFRDAPQEQHVDRPSKPALASGQAA